MAYKNTSSVYKMGYYLTVTGLLMGLFSLNFVLRNKSKLIMIYKLWKGLSVVEHKNPTVKFYSRYMAIYLTYLGKEVQILLPYNAVNSFGMADLQLSYEKDDDIITINSLPGVPYLITAKDLQVEKITVTNTFTEQKKEYIEDEKIGYCEDIYD